MSEKKEKLLCELKKELEEIVDNAFLNWAAEYSSEYKEFTNDDGFIDRYGDLERYKEVQKKIESFENDKEEDHNWFEQCQKLKHKILEKNEQIANLNKRIEELKREITIEQMK